MRGLLTSSKELQSFCLHRTLKYEYNKTNVTCAKNKVVQLVVITNVIQKIKDSHVIFVIHLRESWLHAFKVNAMNEYWNIAGDRKHLICHLVFYSLIHLYLVQISQLNIYWFILSLIKNESNIYICTSLKNDLSFYN